jgi:hypothetical protein
MPVASSALQLCADFVLFPDDHHLGSNFSLAGFDFSEVSGAGFIFVNETANEKGLQFDPQGVEITLPIPVKTVDMRVGAFAGPVDIVAFDSAGNQVRQRTLSILNRYVNIRLSASEIASIILSNGNNEGILVRICIAIGVC